MLPRSVAHGVLCWGLPLAAGLLATIAWKDRSWLSPPIFGSVVATCVAGGALWGWAASTSLRRREQERMLSAFGTRTRGRTSEEERAISMGLVLVLLGLVILVFAVHGVVAGSDHYTSIGLAVVLVSMGLAHSSRQPPRSLVRICIAVAALTLGILRIVT